MRYVKYLIVLSIVLMCLLAATPRRVSACSCDYPNSPQVALSNAAAVFAGKVVQIELVKRPRLPGSAFMGEVFKVTVQVVSVWKGQLSSELIVYTGTSEAGCGYAFHVDRAYLVYAYANGNEELETGYCLRTQPLVATGEDLKALGEGQTPVSLQKSPTKEHASVPATPVTLSTSLLIDLVLPALAALVIIGLILGRRIISRNANG